MSNGRRDKDGECALTSIEESSEKEGIVGRGTNATCAAC